MKVINKYILKECIPPFFVGSFFFTLIFVIDKIRVLFQLILEKDTPILIASQLFIYMLPFTVVLTIPMGILFGVLMAFGRFSNHSEIIAMRACGISVYRIFKPVLWFGIFMSIFMLIFINYIKPESNYRYKTIYQAIAVSNPGIVLKDRVFKNIPNTTKKISSTDISKDGKTMSAVILYETDDTGVNITFAKTGTWVSNELNSPRIYLVLEDGETLRMKYNISSQMSYIKFDSISLNIENNIRVVHSRRGNREYSAMELLKQIREEEKKTKEISVIKWIEFHKQFSIPLACVVFVIIAMPLGITFQRSGKAMSIGLGIIIVFIYYILLTMGETLGYKRIIGPATSMWVSNAVLLVIGLFFFIKRARE